jgi:hypothetical protein
MGPLDNTSKLAILRKMIKGEYYDYDRIHKSSSKLKGASSSSLITALDQHLLENINKNPLASKAIFRVKVISSSSSTKKILFFLALSSVVDILHRPLSTWRK